MKQKEKNSYLYIAINFLQISVKSSLTFCPLLALHSIEMKGSSVPFCLVSFLNSAMYLSRSCSLISKKKEIRDNNTYSNKKGFRADEHTSDISRS